MAVINSGMAFGIAAGMLAASAALSSGGGAWRAPFVVLGMLTLAFAGLLAKSVTPDPPGAAGDRGKMEAAPASPPGRRRRPAAPARNVLLSYVVALATMYGFFVVLTWLPYYLETQRGLPAAQSGLVSTIIAFTAVPAGIVAGRVSDRMGRRRPLLLLLTPLSGLALAYIVRAPGLGGVYGAVALYGVTGKLVVDPLIVALVADATPRENYGSAFGILNFAGTISTVLAPALTGYIADLTGTFTAAFLLAAVLQGVAALCVAAMRPERAVAGRTDQGGEQATMG
jgi:MFS family permease